MSTASEVAREGYMASESSRIPTWARVLRVVGRRWPEHRGKWRLWRLLHHLGCWPSSVVIDMPDGRLLEVNLRDLAHFGAYWAGHYERDTEWLLAQSLRPGDVFIDAGANVGFLATLASKLVESQGQVHCFEPVSENLQKLARNIALNALTNVTVSAVALGEQTGKAYIHRFRELSSSQSSLCSLGRADSSRSQCDVIRLDDYANHHELRSVRLVKLDVEGAEFPALRGGEAMLRRHRPILIVELNQATARSFGYHPHDMLNWLRGVGYLPHRVAGGKIQAVSELRDLDLAASNVLLLPKA